MDFIVTADYYRPQGVIVKDSISYFKVTLKFNNKSKCFNLSRKRDRCDRKRLSQLAQDIALHAVAIRFHTLCFRHLRDARQGSIATR